MYENIRMSFLFLHVMSKILGNFPQARPLLKVCPEWKVACVGEWVGMGDSKVLLRLGAA